MGGSGNNDSKENKNSCILRKTRGGGRSKRYHVPIQVRLTSMRKTVQKLTACLDKNYMRKNEKSEAKVRKRKKNIPSILFSALLAPYRNPSFCVLSHRKPEKKDLSTDELRYLYKKYRIPVCLGMAWQCCGTSRFMLAPGLKVARSRTKMKSG